MSTDRDAGLQSPDVDTRAIIALVAGFLVFAAISVVGLHAYYVHEPAHEETPTPRQFPQPRLETRNRQDLAALLKRQREEFGSYAWVDRGHSLVRIPIAKAMQILAARGDSAYDAPATTAAPLPSPASTPMAAPKPTPTAAPTPTTTGGAP
jgi:hypothetical protein